MIGERLLSEDEWDEIAERSDGGSLIAYECPRKGCPHHFDADREMVINHLEDRHGVTPDGVQEIHFCWFCGEGGGRRSEVAEHVREEHGDRLGDRGGDGDPETWETVGDGMSAIDGSSADQPCPCCPECHRRSGFTLGRDGKLVCPGCSTEFDPYSEQGALNAPRNAKGLTSDAIDPDGDEPGEFWCPECGARVTRSPIDPAIEYGHRPGHASDKNGGERCSRRPATVDSTDSRRKAAFAAHESMGIGRFAAREESEGEEGSA